MFFSMMSADTGVVLVYISSRNYCFIYSILHKKNFLLSYNVMWHIRRQLTLILSFFGSICCYASYTCKFKHIVLLIYIYLIHWFRVCVYALVLNYPLQLNSRMTTELLTLFDVKRLCTLASPGTRTPTAGLMMSPCHDTKCSQWPLGFTGTQIYNT